MDSNFWERLRLGFTQLRADCAINPPILQAGRLTAIWTAQPEPAGWRLEHWNKEDGNGVAQRFRWLAQSAAARLGFARVGTDAVSFWLDHIRLDAPESHLRDLFIEGEESNQLYSVEILDICGLSADYCWKCEAEEVRSEASRVKGSGPQAADQFQDDANVRPLEGQTALGRNINRLRKECGWSFDELANQTKIEKKLILGHVNNGKGAHPRNLRNYADAFAGELGRPVSVEELES